VKQLSIDTVGQSADERRYRPIIEVEIQRESAKRRGPKRDPEKATRIFITILFNDKMRLPALTFKEIQNHFPDIGKADLGDYLRYLTKIPGEQPLLIATRMKIPAHNHEPGAMPLQYTVNRHHRQDTSLKHIEASIVLAE
jgi:hypothetical protein